MLQTNPVVCGRFYLSTHQDRQDLLALGSPSSFFVWLTVLSSGLGSGPSSRPWATQATYAPPPTHQRGARPFWWDPAPRWEGGSGAAWRPAPGSGLPMSVGAQAGFARLLGQITAAGFQADLRPACACPDCGLARWGFRGSLLSGAFTQAFTRFSSFKAGWPF